MWNSLNLIIILLKNSKKNAIKYNMFFMRFSVWYSSWMQVMFVNANSQMYTRQPNQCEFTLSAFESVSGELDSPKHTLPPNTVCRYNFQGRRHEIVWITFTKYHSAVDQSVFEAPTECMPQLRIWDGKLRASNKNGKFSVVRRNFRWT